LGTSEKKNLTEVSVGCVLFGFHATELKVLLLKLNKAAHWVLPGGGIRRNERIEEAALRAMKETAGIQDVYLQQFHTFGGTDRYKYYSKDQTTRLIGKSGDRAQGNPFQEATISVGYYALVDFDNVTPGIQ
jgi:ADP-ribose pyrophosphatase YjhB (NUDIX family)